MKKQVALAAILFSIVLGSFNIGYRILPVAHATYVEGAITQNTIWTLADSPFVLSDDVIVNSGVALTIEPGVQVRFGGNFSLVVNGRIIADGTEERMILFTTNDPSQQILWNTIEIRGPGSVLTNCLVECGINGTTLNGGILNVEKSIIRSNLITGITVNSGLLTIQDSEISNNNGTAISITGGYQVAISKNRIESNGNGLILSGDLLGTISIQQNEISNNSGAGVILQANTLTDTLIAENSVSANGFGFLVANASTYISRNYISGNNVGAYYTGESHHLIQFNDIYDNELGMDIDPESEVTVNASHNYWGDKTGPRHQSMNPRAKGNSVNGDGVNIDFLPFLTHSFTYSNIRPSAVLWTDKVLVAPYQTVTFIGTDSQDDGSVDQYFFDFGDGTNSSWTSLSLSDHSYSTTGTYLANLAVEDDFGSESTTVAMTVNVVGLTPLETSVTLANSTLPFDGETWVTVYVSTALGGVANANVTLLSVRGGTFEPQTGSTDANGYFTAKFTAPNVTQVTDVRIIARASMTNYADGSDYKYVRVLPPLRIQVTPVIPSIWSEETITLNVEITNPPGDPVEGANLALSCTEGSLSQTTLTTDIDGNANFAFTAPLTSSQVNVTITVQVSKSEYADTIDQSTVVIVKPKEMSLEIIPSSNTILSGTELNITVQATHNMTALQDVNVTIAATSGTFAPITAMTDSYGNVTFMLTSPEVTESSNVTLMVVAAKAGYLETTGELDILVDPKTFLIQLTPSTVRAGQEETLTVQLTCNETEGYADAALVTMSYGSGQPSTNITDVNGTCTFIINALQTADNLLNITVKANRIGYREKQATFTLNVLPGEGGLSWLTILIIAIPIAVAIVVAVLIKMKVIVISTKEEETGSE